MSEQQEQDKKRAKRGLANVYDYQKTFTTPHGKKVLWHLMKRNGVLDSVIEPGDPYITAHNDGRRCAIVEILGRLKINPDKLEQMVKQAEENDG